MSSSPSSRGDLIALARALGGELHGGGARILAPAPGHSAADRSVSLRLVGDRVLVHSFGAADWREVLDDLRRRGWIDEENRLRAGGAPVTAAAGPSVQRTRAERVRAAAALWSSAQPVALCEPAALHCAARGIALGEDPPDALRGRLATPAAIYGDAGPRWAALLARVDAADGELTAVEVTYLDRRGARSRLARPSRKLVGVLPAGSAVRLGPLAPDMLVAEGVFTTLSAMRLFRRPGWALLSTSNLRRWRPPAGVPRLLIAGDRGRDGERSAEILRAAAAGLGISTEVVLPPPGAGDWNDVLCAEAKEGRGGSPGP